MMVEFDGFPYIYYFKDLEGDYIKKYNEENIKKQQAVFQVSLQLLKEPGLPASAPDLRSGAYGAGLAAIGFYSAGYTLLKKGDYNKARANFSQTIKLQPNHFLAFKFRGLTYYEKKEYKPAIINFTEAIRLHPINTGKFNKISLDKFSEEEKKSFKSGLAELYFARGCSYDNNGKENMAIADFNMALKINPLLQNFDQEQDICFFSDRLKACSLFGISDIPTPDSKSNLFMPLFSLFAVQGVCKIAGVFINNKQYNNSIEILSKLLDVTPNQSIVFELRGIAQYEKKEYDCAINDYNEALRINNLVIANYNEAVRLNTISSNTFNIKSIYLSLAEIYYRLGMAFIEKEEYDLAINNLKEALKFKSDFSEANDMLQKIINRKNSSNGHGT